MKANRENTKTENEDENLVLIKDLKIDKLLAILIKKIKTQITNIRNESDGIIIDATDIKRKTRE